MRSRNEDLRAHSSVSKCSFFCLLNFCYSSAEDVWTRVKLRCGRYSTQIGYFARSSDYQIRHFNRISGCSTLYYLYFSPPDTQGSAWGQQEASGGCTRPEVDDISKIALFGNMRIMREAADLMWQNRCCRVAQAPPCCSRRLPYAKPGWLFTILASD